MAFSMHHEVGVANARAHLLHVTTTVRAEAPLAEPLVLFMPVWTPGSYLVREYARHVESLTCEGGHATKVRKNAWRIDADGARSVVVRYQVYCNELTVRTNHVDDTHAFINGAATFLAIEGHERTAATVRVSAPEGWRTATALPSKGAGLFEAADLDTLVDCPIEVGAHHEETFDVLGKAHTFVFWPPDRVEAADVARLVADTRTILEGEARLFEGALPYDRYLLLLFLSPRGRGGLEHKSCCSLIASPQSFTTRDGYLDLLSLVAHEAFHAWNVKRIRPEGLTPYRYQTENYTRLLWWFEGATSYYDWRTLRTNKLCTVEEYLEHLATEIGHLDETHGRLVHSLEEASFDAWIKLYRPDENSSNSSVSYYRKGEIVCALLDLELRGRTGGRVGLDAVLAHLWERYGARNDAVPEGGMQGIFEGVAGIPLGDLFDAWIRTPGDIDYSPTLARAGLRIDRPVRETNNGTGLGGPRPSLGFRTRMDGRRMVVSSVVRGAAAQRGGIDPGDEIVAIAGKRVDASTTVDALLARCKPKDDIEIVLARDGRLVTRAVTLDEHRPERVKLLARSEATPGERALFTAWLGDAHPAWGGDARPSGTPPRARARPEKASP